jgi:hypothetical protein
MARPWEFKPPDGVTDHSGKNQEVIVLMNDMIMIRPHSFFLFLQAPSRESARWMRLRRLFPVRHLSLWIVSCK